MWHTATLMRGHASQRLAGGSTNVSSCISQQLCLTSLLLFAGPDLECPDDDAHSKSALGAAIKALQAAFWDRDGPPVVVFDGLHAEDLPVSEQVHKAI